MTSNANNFNTGLQSKCLRRRAARLTVGRYKDRLLSLALIALLLLQVAHWRLVEPIKPDLGIVPPVPGEMAVKALSFGDEQFYFRTLAFELQNAGDTFGRSTALREYDYSKLYQWFKLLDTLDNRSHFIPALASYYFGLNQKTSEIRYVVDYLAETSRADMEHKWWWMWQGAYLANHRLKDKQRALALAQELAQKGPASMPIWAKQMPAIIHAQLGERGEALAIIKNLMENEKDLTPGEINYMHFFINERLNTIINDAKHSNKPERQVD